MSDPEKPDVTAPVTEPETPKKPKEKTAWERVNLTKEEWDALEIPPMFRRAHSDTKPARPPSPASSPTPSIATAPTVSSSAGKKSGKRRSSGTVKKPISTTDQLTKTGTEASSTAPPPPREPTRPSEPTPPAESAPSLTDFNKFKIVTPEDIEKKIRHEADRRYRDWTPSAKDTRTRKGKTSRPRLEWFIKQVRKEFY